MEPEVDALVIVDAQRAFLTEHTEGVLPKIRDLIQQASTAGIPVVATRFVNQDASLYRSLIGWHECGMDDPGSELLDGIENASTHVLIKGGYSSRGRLPECLTTLGATRPLLIGFDTESCVLACAVELFDHLIPPVIDTRACASTGGPDDHRCGVAVLRRVLGEGSVI